MPLYKKSAPYYDLLYAGKDYRGEARRLDALIRRYKRSAGTALLDVACGTGGHIAYLKHRYAVEGLDLEPALLAIARRKHPDVRFRRGDMERFDLGRRFDAVICLFSAIGYVTTRSRLHRAVRTMGTHLRPGGVLIIEPWLTPERFEPGRADGIFINHPGLKIARMNTTQRTGRRSTLTFHHLVGQRGQISHFVERHVLGLFTLGEYATALRAAGLRTIVERRGLTGRGLLIGIAPMSQERPG